MRAVMAAYAAEWKAKRQPRFVAPTAKLPRRPLTRAQYRRAKLETLRDFPTPYLAARVLIALRFSVEVRP